MADEEENRVRVAVALVCIGVVVLIGLPVWWNTTKVYRATLPYADIQQLSSVTISALVRVSVILGNDESRWKSLSEMINNEMTQKHGNTTDHKDVPLAFNYAITTRLTDAKEDQILNSTDNEDTLDTLDDRFQQLWDSNRSDVKNDYKVILLPKEGAFATISQNMHCFVGKYHHAIVFYGEDLQHTTEIIGHVVRDVFVQEKAVLAGYSHHVHAKTEEEALEQMRDLKSTTGFHLSFSLINDEPETGILTWNIRDAISGTLQPLLNKISHFDISVDSQILHYSGVNLHPQVEGDVSYLTKEDLPHMINPIEAKLGSYVSLNPSLNFIVFVPPRGQTPLKIRDSDGVYSSTNAFLSPRWGGVLIHNVYNRSDSNGSAPVTIPIDMTSTMMNVFLSQLRLLIGIKPVEPTDGVVVTSVINSGARDWEIQHLTLVKAMEYLSSSKDTLQSLTQLIDKVKNMVIADSIKDEIEQAVDSIKKSHKEMSQGNIFQAFLSAKKAIQSSEKAFFDPSVLELLYFPDDQKYAIYIPLFLPISLPLLVSLFVAIKWFRSKDSKSEIGDDDTDKKSQ